MDGVYTDVVGKLKKYYQMTENFKIIGEWFLPSNPGKRVHGTLEFKQEEGITLEIYGSLTSDIFFPELIDQEIILGLTSKSKQITLYGCNMTSSGGATLVQGRESGKSSVSYSILYALEGLYVNEPSELLFDKVTCEIFNLDEWVGISGFDMPLDFEKIKKHEINVNYKLPEPIEFKIDNEAHGRFYFTANHPGVNIYQKTINVTQKVKFQVNTKTEKKIDDLLSYVFSFQNFLILALYRSTYPLKIKLFGEKHKETLRDGETNRKTIELFFSSSNLNKANKAKLDFDMIFTYRGIKDKFPDIIQKWYSHYELLEPALNLVFEQFYNGNRFNENTFLNLAQAAETFHARTNNYTKIPREEYKEMKEEILKLTPSKYHKWLKDQFNLGNNLNLQLRLEDLIHKYSNTILDKIIPDKEIFVKQVKHSRNYYTHYSTSSKKNALKGGELFYLSEKLKILLVCAFLIEIGFDKELITRNLDNVKWRLFNHLANWRDDK